IFLANVQDEAPYTVRTYNPSSHYYYSGDGTNWTQGAVGGAFQNQFRFLSFANGAFDIFGYSVNSEFFYSTPDGNTQSFGLLSGTFGDATALSYGASRYVLLGTSGEIWNSTDLTNWVPENGGFQGNFTQITQGTSNLIVAGSSLPLLVSSNGVTFNTANA